MIVVQFRKFWRSAIGSRAVLIGIICGCVVVAASAGCNAYLSDRILPNTLIGSVSVGRLTRAEAEARLAAAVAEFQNKKIHLIIGDIDETIDTDSIGFDIDVQSAIDQAYERGHTGPLALRLGKQVWSLLHASHADAPIHYVLTLVDVQLDDISAATNINRRDIRLSIIGTKIRLLTDTMPGKIIDRDTALQQIQYHLTQLDSSPIQLLLIDDPPRASLSSANAAASAASAIIGQPLALVYEEIQFSVSREKIGSWIISEYDGDQLHAALDTEAISRYVTEIAQALNIVSQPPQIIIDGGRVVGFIPSKLSRSVQQDQLTQLIVDLLTRRATTASTNNTIAIPMKTTTTEASPIDIAVGIRELIGKATTPFTGSPKNRISNIKNGARFLSGTVVASGEEFSTLKALGTIDNTTGYLPELVIKGDRTRPDFGGGLCQVSTTLFRAVLNAGLPVTARRNHSYRVSYYEKDGNGVTIGPGLDATIYTPDPDFRFRNDTSTPILIMGYVVGDKLTFELYGTKDGRASSVDGPHLLSSTPPGEPVYIPSDTLPEGKTLQVETPHPGGSAVATYIITYSDGHTATQIFKSSYRPWPAKYLIGTGVATPVTIE